MHVASAGGALMVTHLRQVSGNRVYPKQPGTTGTGVSDWALPYLLGSAAASQAALVTTPLPPGAKQSGDFENIRWDPKHYLYCR